MSSDLEMGVIYIPQFFLKTKINFVIYFLFYLASLYFVLKRYNKFFLVFHNIFIVTYAFVWRKEITYPVDIFLETS